MKVESNSNDLGFSQEEIKEMIWKIEERIRLRKLGFETPGYGEIEERRGKIMVLATVITHDFVKPNASEFADQLDAFSASLNGLSGPTALATKYKFDTATLLAIKNDAAVWRFWVTKHIDGPVYSKKWTAKGTEERHGTGTSASAWPTATDVSGAPTEVLPGIEPRFRENAGIPKAMKSIYTEADGIAMHIETSSSPFVPGDGKPDLTVRLSDGGHPLLEATKSKYSGFNVYKNSNDGKGFVFLCTCNEPAFMDMAALPASGVSAAWIYKAIYKYDGAEVGTMSNPVTQTVIGAV